MAIDTANKFLVAGGGNEVVTLVPLPNRFSKQDALLLAAYLVCVSMATDAEWQATLDAVRGA